LAPGDQVLGPPPCRGFEAHNRPGSASRAEGYWESMGADNAPEPSVAVPRSNRGEPGDGCAELHLAFLPLVNSGRIDLLDNARMLLQFVGLERRVARSGKDSADHAPGSHDDLSNAVACAAQMAIAPPMSIPLTGPIIVTRADIDPCGRQTHFGTIEIALADWRREDSGIRRPIEEKTLTTASETAGRPWRTLKAKWPRSRPGPSELDDARRRFAFDANTGDDAAKRGGSSAS
jgi:hypothetical protein